MSSRKKTVLILGAGFGGIVAACRLRKALPREHRVILVELEANHVFPPSLLWLMIGERRGDAISRPIAALAKRGIEVVHGNIERIDATHCFRQWPPACRRLPDRCALGGTCA